VRSPRTLVFVALAAVCGAAVVAIGTATVVDAQRSRHAADRAVKADAPLAAKILTSGKPYAVVRTLDKRQSSTYGRVAIAPLNGTTPGTPVLAGPTCGRVAVAAGRGLCLDSFGTTMGVEVLNAKLQQVHEIDLAGIPSRARISPDGRWGGVTAFVVGHAYAAPGTFSTATTLIDMDSGKAVANIEKDFKVYDGGRLVTAQDKNYWGLTFAKDDDTFYATLAANGRTWLIEGSIRARTAHTIHSNVECPSLSPDQTRIGFKKAVAHDPTRWRLTVLNLRTGKETPLAETRSVDDQVYWLDDRHLLYGEDGQTWIVDADGGGRPRVWLPNSDSATVEGARGAAVE